MKLILALILLGLAAWLAAPSERPADHLPGLPYLIFEQELLDT